MREFKSNNLYKLISYITIIIGVVGLVIGGVQIYNALDYSGVYVPEEEVSKGVGNGVATIFKGFLPAILFSGGVSLVRFLYPEKKKKDK